MTGFRKSGNDYLYNIEELECCDLDSGPRTIGKSWGQGHSYAGYRGLVGSITEGSEMVWKTNHYNHAPGGFRICV